MIRNIQGLRFIAALAVVLYHYGLRYTAAGGDGILAPLFQAGSRYGFVGVDVFFVISGFVIWNATATKHEPPDIPAYLWKRLLRIYPTYWVWLAVMGFVWVFIVHKDGFDWLASFLLLPASEGRLVLGVAWTLTFELMFYAVVALTMFGPRIAGFAAIVAWGTVSIVLGFTITTPPVFLNPIISEFALGVVLAELTRRNIRFPLWGCLVLIIAGTVAAEATYMQMEPSGVRWAYRALCFGSVGAGMVAAAIRLEKDGLASSDGTVALGNASYALYLIHTPALHGFVATFWKAAKAYPDAFFGSLALLCVVASLVFYATFEEPINKGRLRIAGPTRIAGILRRLS